MRHICWMVLVGLVALVGCTSAPSPSPQEPNTQAIVPDVVGLTFTEASNALWHVHLNVVSRCNARGGVSCLPDAFVLKQRPQPGTVVPNGTRVRVLLGRSIPIPALVGLPLPRAGERLQRTNLELQFDCVDGPDVRHMRVITQTPAPGTVVSEGSTVNLQVGSPCAL